MAQRNPHHPTPISKVVICDDSPIAQLGVQYALQEFFPHTDFRFWKTTSGTEAIRLVREHAPDLLMLDLHLPGISGLEVLTTLREGGLRTKIVILTSEESVPTLTHLLQQEANAILLKSHTLPELKACLEHVWANDSARTYLDPTLEKLLSRELNNPQLSSRELEVSQLLIQGHTTKAIAELLQCSPETVKTYRARIMEKTQTKNRAELNQWFRHGKPNATRL